MEQMERSLKKTYVIKNVWYISKLILKESLLWNEPSKMFPSHVYQRFAKTQNAFKNLKKSKQMKNFFFKNYGSIFLVGIGNKFWRFKTSRCLPDALFFARFTTWKESPPHKLRFSCRSLPCSLGLKLMSVHIRKKTWKR